MRNGGGVLAAGPRCEPNSTDGRMRISGVGLMILATLSCYASMPAGPDHEATRLEMPLPAPGEWARRLALIVYYDNEPPVVEIPASGFVGRALGVYIRTYNGSCFKDDTAVVSVAANRAEIAPYQRIYSTRAFEACTAELSIKRRRVDVVFPSRGDAIVRVTGRARPGDSLVAVSRRIRIK